MSNNLFNKGRNMKFYSSIIIFFISFSLLGCLACSDKLSDNQNGTDGGTESEKVIYTIDIAGMSNEEKCAVMALQGLANRGSALVMVEPKNTGGFYCTGYQNYPANIVQDGIDPIAESRIKYPALEDVWKDFYKSKYNYSFKALNFNDLFDKFSDKYKGVVIYEGQDENAGIAIAATACGILDGIPVTQQLLEKYSFFSKLPILVDLTKFSFSSRVDAHKWAVEQYLDKCSTKGAFSYWTYPKGNFFTIDYAISQKMFSFSLRFDNDKYCEDGYTYDPEEVKVLDQILGHLEMGSNVWGWGMSPEHVLQGRIGQSGNVLICTISSPNLSFHAGMGDSKAQRKQKRQPHDVELENKVYITFSSNEGDTYKCLGNLICDGIWLHDRRGDIPFNWPMNPQLLTILPGLADYYYSNLTDNDYIYSPTTGLGYFDATFSSTEMRQLFASRNKEYFKNMDIHYMDLWWNLFEGNDEWIKSMGVDGYTTWFDHEKVYYDTAIPCIASEMYYELYWPPTEFKPSDMAKYIKHQGDNEQIKDKPWFIHVYGIDPTFAYRVMQNLPSERYQAVCLDDFFQLALKAKDKIEGIKIDIDRELIKSSFKDQLD